MQLDLPRWQRAPPRPPSQGEDLASDAEEFSVTLEWLLSATRRLLTHVH